MSKDLNVDMRLWEAAHGLEAEAMKAADAVALNRAAYWKGQLSLAIMQDEASGPAKKELEIPGFKAGSGVKGALAGVGPLDKIGVDEDAGQ